MGRRRGLADVGGNQRHPRSARGAGPQLRLAVLRRATHGSPAGTPPDSNLCEALYAQRRRGHRAALTLQGGHCGGRRRDVLRTRAHRSTGLAFYTGASYPSRYQRRAVLRRLLAAVHLGDVCRCATASPTRRRARRSCRAPRIPSTCRSGRTAISSTWTSRAATSIAIRYHGPRAAGCRASRHRRTSGATPLTVTFDGRRRHDPDGTPLSFAWDLNGDGTFGDAIAGDAHLHLWHRRQLRRVAEGHRRGGLSDSRLRDHHAGNTPPSAVIDTPSATLRWRVGQSIAFSGRASDREQATLPASALSWSLIMNHCSTPTSCHEHPIQDFQGVAGGTFVAPDHEYPSYLHAAAHGDRRGWAAVRRRPSGWIRRPWQHRPSVESYGPAAGDSAAKSVTAAVANLHRRIAASRSALRRRRCWQGVDLRLHDAGPTAARRHTRRRRIGRHHVHRQLCRAGRGLIRPTASCACGARDRESRDPGEWWRTRTAAGATHRTPGCRRGQDCPHRLRQPARLLRATVPRGGGTCLSALDPRARRAETRTTTTPCSRSSRSSLNDEPVGRLSHRHDQRDTHSSSRRAAAAGCRAGDGRTTATADPGPLIRFAAAGTQTIRIQGREDGVSIDQIVSRRRPISIRRPGLARRTTRPFSPSRRDWRRPVATCLHVAGQCDDARRMAARRMTSPPRREARLENPNLGAAKLPSPLAAPADYFELSFNARAGRPIGCGSAHAHRTTRTTTIPCSCSSRAASTARRGPDLPHRHYRRRRRSSSKIAAVAGCRDGDGRTTAMAPACSGRSSISRPRACRGFVFSGARTASRSTRSSCRPAPISLRRQAPRRTTRAFSHQVLNGLIAGSAGLSVTGTVAGAIAG